MSTLSPRWSLLALLAVPALAPAPALAHGASYHQPVAAGQLTVTNTAGGPITLRIEGQSPRAVAPWQTVTLALPYGEHVVRATYVQFGQERILQSDRILVTGRGAYLALHPEDRARVLVRNGYETTATLVANGRTLDTLYAGESNVFQLPVGTASFELLVGGRVVASTRLSLQAFAEPTWSPEPPRLGALTVQNPLPIPIQLVCDRGMVRTVQAYGRTTYADLPIGTFHLTARRLTGERIDDQVNVIRGRTESTWRVDAPTTGLVTVDSEHWLPTRVRVDGATVARLSPDEERRLELALGWHRLEVRDDDGRVLLDTWVDVEPFESTALEAGHDHHPRDVDVQLSLYTGGAGCALPSR